MSKCIFTGCRVKLADYKTMVVGDLFRDGDKIILRGIPDKVWAIATSGETILSGPCDLLATSYQELGRYESGSVWCQIEIEALGATPQALERIYSNDPGAKDLEIFSDAPILRVI